MLSDSKNSSFMNIKLHVSTAVPEGELWLISPGESYRATVYEGPQAGTEVEVVVRKPQMLRVVNIGE